MGNYQQLSEELQERIKEDKKAHRINPYAFQNEDVLRRNMDHDQASLWRPAFVRDCEKIMNIPYYNRYGDKTQVFSLYRNDDITRRLTHVQLVSRTARNIGQMLGLNLDLIEAISLGHDIGHTPFGHAGERKLDELYFGRTGRHFSHNIHSARVLDTIFPVNISLQTLDGIICHNGEMEQEKYEPFPYRDFAEFDRKMEACYMDTAACKKLVPATLEACVMRVSDIIAYLGKDRQDAMKLGLLQDDSGFTVHEILMPINNRLGIMQPHILQKLLIYRLKHRKNLLIKYFCIPVMFIYSLIILFFGFGKCRIILGIHLQVRFSVTALYDIDRHIVDDFRITLSHYRHHIEYIRSYTRYYSRKNDYEGQEANAIVADYMASMTDDYFIDLYEYLFPKGKYKVKYKGYFE